jgi:hypothetical protein
VDLSKLSSRERVIAGGALVAFIASFLPWWGVSLGFVDLSVDGWSAGFTAWAGSLLLTAAGAYLVARRSGASLPVPSMGEARVVAALAGIGLFLVIIRLATLPGVNGLGVGTRYGIWIALLAGVSETIAAFAETRAAPAV